MNVELTSSLTLEPPEIAEKRIDAERYLARHALLPVLTRLVEKVSHDRPDNPRAAMAGMLREMHSLLNKLKEQDASNKDDTRIAIGKILYSEDDMRAIFKLTDTVDRGSITRSQYIDAAKYLGLSSSRHSDGAGNLNLNEDEFCRAMLIECGRCIEPNEVPSDDASTAANAKSKTSSPKGKRAQLPNNVTQVKRASSPKV